jgi:nitroreductase
MDLSKLGDFTGPLTNAAMAVAILTPDPTSNYWLMFDAGQAVAYMQLAALELGIGSCIVSLHRPQTAGQILGFPDDLELHAMLAFGYPAEQEALKAPPRTGGRRAAEEIAFYERWGNTSPPQS